MFYHSFSSEGFVKVFLEDARIKVLLVAKSIPDVNLDNFDQVWAAADLAPLTVKQLHPVSLK